MSEKVAERMKTITHTEKPSSNRGLSKTTVVYWSRKVSPEKKGAWKSTHYYVRYQVAGERRKLRLDATTKEEAAKEALGKYLWDLTKSRNEQQTSDCPVTTVNSVLPPIIERSGD